MKRLKSLVWIIQILTILCVLSINVWAETNSDNLLTNPGFESDFTGWELDDGNQAIRNSDNPPPHSGESYLMGSSGKASSYTSQRIDLIANGFSEQDIDSGMYSVHFGGWQAGWQTQTDKGKIEIILSDGTSDLASSDLGWFYSNNTWTLKEGKIDLVAGTRYITFGFHALRDSGSNNDAYLDDAFVFIASNSAEEDGLVAYYPFNGDANDESGNGNHGTVNGAVLTSDRFGKPNTAYNFDGNSNITVSDSASLDIADAISVTGWINPSSLSPSWQTIVAKGNEPSENYAIFLEGTKTLHIANVINGKRYYWNSDSLVTQADNWYLFTVTYDGETEKCYINGTYAGSKEISGTLTTNDYDLQIGMRGNGASFYGIIDDIRIYNRALSESEIQSLYQQGDGFITNLTANKTTGNAPLTVEFTDRSTGNPTSWQWDFNNDGIIDSTLQNPVFNYHNQGIYSVKLVVTIEDTEYEVLKTGYITVNEPVNPLPDLQVTQVETSQAIAGQTIEVSWTVSDTGEGNTSVPVWYDRVWISPDIDVWKPNPEDILLGEFQNVSYLGAGESYIQTQQFTLPDDIKGIYYLFVVTDNYDAYNVNQETMEASTHSGTKVNLLPETNDKNNFKFMEIEITPPPPSDLSVTSMATRSEAFSGEQINVSWTIENIGENNTNAESWWDVVYFSQDTVLNIENATLLGKYNHSEILEDTGMLIPGDSYQMSVDVNIPQAVYGDYFIFVVTDIYDDVYEQAYESNNQNKQAISVTLTPPPDLEITELAVPDSADSGQSVNIQWTVENKGSGELSDGYWRDGIYLHTDSEFDAESAILIGTFSKSGSLLLNSDYSKDVNITIPNGLEGSYYVFVKTDNDSQVFEHLYEDNNLSVGTPIQISLSPWADLQVSDIQVPSSVTAGEKVNITFTVANEGEASASSNQTELYISEDTEFSTEDDTLLTSISYTDSLSATRSYSRTANVTIPTDLDGTYYIFVIADANDEVYEHTGEDNNMRQSSSFTVLAYPPTDLVVSDFSIPGSGSSGQSVDVSYSVKNLGEGATLSSEWYDVLYFSSDTELDTSKDTLLKKISHGGALAYQETYSANVSVNLPDGVSGDYYLIIKADSNDRITETSEENNASNALVTVELTPPSDLQVISYEIPAQGVAGQPLVISWMVRNKGNGAINITDWYDGVFLSLDDVLDRSDTRLTTTTHSGSLNSGEDYSTGTEVELPIFASGNYYLLIKTDSGENVYEHEAEENNVVSGSVSVTIPPPSDLIVTDITVPENAVPGELVTISWTIKNQGINTASGRMYEAVYVSEDANWEFTDPMLGTVSREIELAPGNELRMSMKADIRKSFRADENGKITETLPGVVGEHYIAVRTDVRNNIRESDITNNTLVSDDVMNVSIPDLAADVALETTLAEMQKKYYRIDVAEGLDLRITLTGDVSGASNEVYVAFDRVPTLIDHDYAGTVPFEVDQEVLVPSTQAGTYYILVMARALPDGAESENVTLLAEPKSFSITGITPDTGGAGGRVTCTLTGAGFRDSSQVFLRISEDSLLEGEVIEFVNTMQMKVRWDLDGVSLGSYDVVVENANGSTAEYSNGFTVEKSTGMKIEIVNLSADVLRAGVAAPMTFHFLNTGNIDIPYLKVHILVPTYVTPKSIENSSGLLKKSDLYKDYPEVSIDDFNYAYIDLGDENIEFNLIEFIAKDVYPGELLKSNIVFAGFEPPEFPLQVAITTMNVNEFATSELGKIESMRLNILENPDNFDDDIVIFAENQMIFLNSMFQDNYVENGVVESNKLNEVIGNYILNPHLDIPSIKHKTNRGKIFSNLTCVEEVTGFCGTGFAAGCFYAGVVSSPFITPVGGGILGTLCTGLYGMICLNGARDICTPVQKSVDPNEMIGPSGYNHEKWISKGESLPYTIRFENDPELATAPAQVVSIRQTLDSDLDPRTFRLGSFGFGEHIFNVPENTAYYSDRLDLTESLGIYVDVSAGIDINTNKVFWIFRSIDPATGQAPTDPFAGFLPVNDPETHVGEGFVNYTIKAKETAITGDVIDAQAQIVFDVNDPIDTPAIFNTIDADTPTSKLQNKAELVDNTTFTLTRTAQDAESGSGLQDVTLYMATDDGPYQIYEANLTDTSLTVMLDPEHTYRFFTIANDNAGNAESMKTESELVIDLSTDNPTAGDVNQDSHVDLTDAILALQILSENTPADATVNKSADVNGDGKIGIEDVIYILRRVLN